MTKGYLNMARALILAAAVSLAIACGPSTGIAQTPQPPAFETSGNRAFDEWRDDFARRAVQRGRDPAIVGRLLAGLTPDDRVIELDQRQPEFVSPVWDYVTNRVTENRISGGRALKASIGSTLDAVEARYGVPTGIILGIWGLESNYGEAALNWTPQAALATLAYEGRRREQFESYLLALIEMVERDPSSQQQLRSSWAGALGQPQFMPDVYLTTAVDWDGDGHRDIWNNRGDVAASIGNYMQDRITELRRRYLIRKRTEQPESRGEERWDKPRVSGERRRRIARVTDLPTAPPEPPQSGYICFLAQMTTKIRHDRPDEPHDQSRVMSEISRMWRLALSDDEREYYK